MMMTNEAIMLYDSAAEQAVAVSYINSVPVHICIIPTITDADTQLLYNTPPAAAASLIIHCTSQYQIHRTNSAVTEHGQSHRILGT